MHATTGGGPQELAGAAAAAGAATGAAAPPAPPSAPIGSPASHAPSYAPSHASSPAVSLANASAVAGPVGWEAGAESILGEALARLWCVEVALTPHRRIALAMALHPRLGRSRCVQRACAAGVCRGVANKCARVRERGSGGVRE